MTKRRKLVRVEVLLSVAPHITAAKAEMGSALVLDLDDDKLTAMVAVE